MLLPMLLVPMLISGPQAAAQTAVSGVPIVIFQVQGSPGAERELPKVLEPFAKRLARTLFQRFTLLEKARELRLEPNVPVVLQLTQQLGTAEVVIDPQGKLTVKMTARDKTALGSVSTNTCPVIVVNDRLKLGPEQKDQFILIVHRKEPSGGAKGKPTDGSSSPEKPREG